MDISRHEGTPQKLCQKMAAVLNSYKDTRTVVDGTGRGVIFKLHDETPDGQSTDGAKTIRQIIPEKCLWYYVYEEFMCDKPNASPSFLSESGQPDRRHLKSVDADGEGTADAPGDSELNGTQLLDTQVESDNATDTIDASDEDTSSEEKEEEAETGEMIVEANDVSISTARTIEDDHNNVEPPDGEKNLDSTLIEDSKSSSFFKSPTPAPKLKKAATAEKIDNRRKDSLQ